MLLAGTPAVLQSEYLISLSQSFHTLLSTDTHTHTLSTASISINNKSTPEGSKHTHMHTRLLAKIKLLNRL